MAKQITAIIVTNKYLKDPKNIILEKEKDEIKCVDVTENTVPQVDKIMPAMEASGAEMFGGKIVTVTFNGEEVAGFKIEEKDIFFILIKFPKGTKVNIKNIEKLKESFTKNIPKIKNELEIAISEFNDAYLTDEQINKTVKSLGFIKEKTRNDLKQAILNRGQSVINALTKNKDIKNKLSDLF